MVSRVYEKRQEVALKSSQFYLSDEHRYYDLLNLDGRIVLKGHYGMNIPTDLQPDSCKIDPQEKEVVYGPSSTSKYCREWKYRAHLDINMNRHENDVICYHFHWTGVSDVIPLKDCLYIGGAFWFGGGQIESGHWPLNGLSMNATPFVSSHDPMTLKFGSIIKRYFISSHGVAIFIPLNVPLFVSFNATSKERPRGDSLLCFKSRPNTPPYFTPSLPAKQISPHLDYSICSGRDMFSLHSVVFKNWTRKLTDPYHQQHLVSNSPLHDTLDFEQEHETTTTPTGGSVANSTEQDQHQSTTTTETVTTPTTVKASHEHSDPFDFIHHVIWTTDGSVSIPIDLNATAITTYTDSILHHGHDAGFLLIDNRWEKKVGLLLVNETAFPDLKSFYKNIHSKGFRTILSVSPFMGIGNPIVEEASREERFLQDPNLRVPLLTHCFSGQKQDLCTLIDVVNKTSRLWFWKRFDERVYHRHNYHGLYFAGVQVSRMPRRLKDPEVKLINPDYYQVFYTHISLKLSNDPGWNGFDTAVGHQKSDRMFYRLLPRESSWKSLQTIIPTVLSVSLIGYNMINPGSIGGDWGLSFDTYDKELYIRWMQLSMFLPVLQFSDPPAVISRNDPDIVGLFDQLMLLRKRLIEPAFLEALEEHENNSFPIIRGMNFLDPGVSDAHRIKDQFAIGHNLIVAPILHAGQRKKTIFLPKGTWILPKGVTLDGRQWLEDYDIPLLEVAYFVRKL